MLKAYDDPKFAYRRSPDQDLGGDRPAHHPVVVVGAGPVGLTAAIDLAGHGVPVLVLDDDDTVSIGSRAICWSKRTLEICDRLGIGDILVEHGITWKVGRVFLREEEVYSFDLLPEDGHKMPAFVNLQQYHFEEFAIRRAEEDGAIDLRWMHSLAALEPGDPGAPSRLAVETPDGRYTITADWVIACDGAKSATRKMLGLDFEGQVFQDRFLIADVLMKADFPTERWFWFDPPFNPGQSALLHKQANDVWRIDLQLGPDADAEEAKKPENVIPRLKRMLGEDVAFELEWVSVYTFQCRRLEKFRHGPVLFAGDSAHQVSPFGARGGNGGIQDTDNLAWKLDLVLRGLAPESLLDTYDTERIQAADENILNSTRSTDFITPKNKASRDFRDAVLDLSAHHGFARRLVNSGRLSLPRLLQETPLSTPDRPEETFECAMTPGAPAADAPIRIADRSAWLLGEMGRGFTLLHLPGRDGPALSDIRDMARENDIPLRPLILGEDFEDDEGRVVTRYDLQPGTTYLVRPDQHVAARWRTFDEAAVRRALQHACGRPSSHRPERINEEAAV